jgi:hypothetical protein
VDELLAELLGFLLEILVEFVIQMIFELATVALNGLISDREERHPAVSAVGLVFGGAAAGFLSAGFFPNRLIVTRVVAPGASLLWAPLATGVAMHLLGRRLRRLERPATRLATFWGGALFAVSMALVRWWLVGLRH